MARATFRRVTVFAAAAALGTFGWTAPASAGGISAVIADRQLTVTGTDQDDTITIRCDGGDVTVNQSRPSGGADACRGLRKIVVAAGGGADVVHLGDVTRSAFADLTRVQARGEEGADRLVGSEFGDELHGGGGVDELRGGRGADVFKPGAGAGEVVGGKGHDTVAMSGDDRWTADDSRVTRFTPDEVVTELAAVEKVVIEGGAGDNRIVTAAFSGKATLRGGVGADRLVSGPGNDLLQGGKGKDQLVAGARNDVLRGGPGDDELRGGDGNDQLIGGGGDDACVGGPGGDSFLSC
jgi:Ca2+-binding RTX toxin-like protein